MDIATIVGVISAFGLVLMAIFMGGGLNIFINVPALMIVAGGTLGVTMINYPLKEVLGVLKVVRKALFTRTIAVKELIERFMNFANKTRREGILALESELKGVQDEFLKKSTGWNRRRSKIYWIRRSTSSKAGTIWERRFLQPWEPLPRPWV